MPSLEPGKEEGTYSYFNYSSVLFWNGWSALLLRLYERSWFLHFTVQKNHLGPSLDVLKSRPQLKAPGGADAGGGVRVWVCTELCDSLTAAFFRFSRNEGPRCHPSVRLQLGLCGNSSAYSRLPDLGTAWAWRVWMAASCSSLTLDLWGRARVVRGLGQHRRQ